MNEPLKRRRTPGQWRPAANKRNMHERTPTAVERPMTPHGGDFARWAQEQAVAMAAGRWADVDAANVAEEIDALGISQRTEVRSRLRALMAHLLKTEQPERASPSWRDTIVEQAVSIDEVLSASPSLRRELPTFIAYAYPRPRRLAAKKTGMPLSTFPKMPTPAFEAALAAALVEDEPEAD